jgi:hypothetical protein
MRKRGGELARSMTPEEGLGWYGPQARGAGTPEGDLGLFDVPLDVVRVEAGFLA